MMVVYVPNMPSPRAVQLAPSAEYAILPSQSPATNLLLPQAMASMALANVLSATAVHVEGPLTGAAVVAGVAACVGVVAGAGVGAVGSALVGTFAPTLLLLPRLQATKAAVAAMATRAIIIKTIFLFILKPFPSAASAAPLNRTGNNVSSKLLAPGAVFVLLPAFVPAAHFFAQPLGYV
jgi:hypothetical protein